ncbi:MAG: hypothetical protein R6U27_05670, partial [Desulfobacterales bacterium]
KNPLSIIFHNHTRKSRHCNGILSQVMKMRTWHHTTAKGIHVYQEEAQNHTRQSGLLIAWTMSNSSFACHLAVGILNAESIRIHTLFCFRYNRHEVPY